MTAMLSTKNNHLNSTLFWDNVFYKNIRYNHTQNNEHSMTI